MSNELYVRRPQNDASYPTHPNSENNQLTEAIAGVIDVFHKHSIDARLAGSYGRAAAINGDPPTRYKEDLSELRDIDLMIVQHERINPSLEIIKQEANSTMHSLGYIDILREASLFSDEDKAQIKYRNIKVDVDPQILSMHEGKIYDVSIPTFDPMTHFHLTGVHGHMRKKDFRNLVAFGRQIRQLPTLPDEIFEPFHELYKQIANTYPLERPFFAMTEWYRDHIPYEMRKKLVPIMKPIKDLILPKK